MVKEDSNTQVEQFMMANGKWIKSRDTVSACIRMVKYMREIGLMIYVMEMELIHILMAENMMEIGKSASNFDVRPKPFGPNVIYRLINKQTQLTKKELIEGGWIDKYVLGLTSEAESSEVERLASLYPEVQEQINLSRNKICGNFNRNLTQPALRHSFLTKRRMMVGSAAVVFLALAGLAFLWKEHFYLKEDYNYQCAKLAEQQAKVDKMSTVSRQVSERSNFINSSTTERIKVRGCKSTRSAFRAMPF